MYMPYIETNGKPFTNFAEVLEQGAAEQRASCSCLSQKVELLSNKKQCHHGCLYCYWR